MQVTGRTDIVNMSFGYTIPVDDATRTLHEELWTSSIQAGSGPEILWVAAAGNEKIQTDCDGEYANYPSNLSCSRDNVISVGGYSVRPQDDKANVFNYGTAVTTTAPGTGVLTADGLDTYGFFGGTSAATPLVTGALALLLSTKKFLPSMAKQLLLETAEKFPDPQAPSQGGLDILALIKAEQRIQTK